MDQFQVDSKSVDVMMAGVRRKRLSVKRNFVHQIGNWPTTFPGLEKMQVVK
jgi:hypothetical protein